MVESKYYIMYLVTEKDEYSEVDLLDYDWLIKKANKRFKVNIIISIVILGIAAIVALIGLLMKLNVIQLIFNLRAYDVLMTFLFFVLLSFTDTSFANILTFSASFLNNWKLELTH